MIAALLLTLSAAPALAGPSDARVPAQCSMKMQHAAKTGQPLRATPLNREPNAAKIAALWRQDSRGCPQPIVLQDDIGSQPRRAVTR